MKTKRKIINLFKDKDLLSIKYVVSISNEKELDQFWDFITISKSITDELMHTFLTQFYNFAISYIIEERVNFFEIIVEESEKYFYFTLWNKNVALIFKKYLSRTSLNFIYKDKRLTIKLDKLKFQEKRDRRKLKNSKREENLIKSVNSTNKLEIKPYTFLKKDDLNELLTLSDEMKTLMSQAMKVGLHLNICTSLRSRLSSLCLTLNYYDEVEQVAKTITAISNLLNKNISILMQISSIELELINGFINNIDTWIQTLFINGGADIYFMDNSIKADYKMIAQMISPSSFNEDKNSVDNIFDF